MMSILKDKISYPMDLFLFDNINYDVQKFVDSLKIHTEDEREWFYYSDNYKLELIDQVKII